LKYHQHQSVQNGDSEQGDEAHGGRHGEVIPGEPQRQNATDQRKGDVRKHQQRLTHRAKSQEQHHEDERQRQWHDQRKSLGSPLLILELATPLEVIAEG